MRSTAIHVLSAAAFLLILATSQGHAEQNSPDRIAGTGKPHYCPTVEEIEANIKNGKQQVAQVQYCYYLNGSC